MQQQKVLGGIFVVESHPAVIEGAQIFQKLRARLGIYDELEDYLSDIKLRLIGNHNEFRFFVRLAKKDDPISFRNLRNRTIWRLKDTHGVKKQKEERNFRSVLLEIAGDLEKPDGTSPMDGIDHDSFVRSIERNFRNELDEIAPRPGPQQHRKIHPDKIHALRSLLKKHFGG